MTSLLRTSSFALLALIFLAAGCDGDGEEDAGPDSGGEMDAGPGGMDAGPGFPDGTVFCEEDGDCDDGIDCTQDSCGATGTCRNVVDNAMCDDGVFCNGVEQCNPRSGCEMGMRETCNDDDVCTVDRCNEETKMCDRFPRDLDGDGDADMFCSGGMDCDDSDPRVSSLLNEVCDDMVDNDCDGLADDMDPEGCGRPQYDICEDTFDVSAGGFFAIPIGGTAPDYSLSCRSFPRDVVAHFTITQPRSVNIQADGELATGISLRGPAMDYTTCDENDPPESEPPCTECTDSSAEIACETGFPAIVRRRRLEPGTYFLVIGNDAASGDVLLDVAFDAPIPPPTNESCLSPTDVSAGGSFRGSTVEVRNDITTSCGGASAPDLVYSFTLSAPQNVQISVVEDGGASMAYSVRTTCGSAMSELRCVSGAPASGTLHQLAAGTYYIIVEGPTFRPADFTLDVQILPPSPPPPGDVCSTAISITPDGTPVTGTFTGFQDDLAVSCGLGGDDVVYTFQLTATSDVFIEYDGPAISAMSLRTNCMSGTGDLRCVRADPVLTRVRNLPVGTYYLVLDSTVGGGYTLSVDATTPPTTPTMVMGNDNCGAVPMAAQMTDTGGLFTGSTTTALPDYTTSVGCGANAASNDVVFQLTLTSPRRVLATTEGSLYDTVLHLHQSMCTSGSPLACNDDAHPGTLTSILDRMLPAGTYYFVVDGFGSFSAGTYFFEVRLD